MSRPRKLITKNNVVTIRLDDDYYDRLCRMELTMSLTVDKPVRLSQTGEIAVKSFLDNHNPESVKQILKELINE